MSPEVMFIIDSEINVISYRDRRWAITLFVIGCNDLVDESLRLKGVDPH